MRCILERTAIVFGCVLTLSLAAGQGTLEDYRSAEKFLPANAGKLVSHSRVQPRWIDESSTFWYRVSTEDGKAFVLVNPEKNSQKPAFDHRRLADALTLETGDSLDSNNLPFDFIRFTDGLNAIEFDIDTTRWSYDLTDYELTGNEREDEPRNLSPDGKWIPFIRDHNLFLRSQETEEEIHLTTDGEPEYDYAYRPSWYKLIDMTRKDDDDEHSPGVSWSPDSKKIATFRYDRRNAQYLYLLRYAPENNLRAVPFAYERALPGDTALAMVEYVLFDVENQKQIPVDAPRRPAFLLGNTPQWTEDGKRLFFLDWHRGYDAVDLVEIDPSTGETRVLIEERSPTRIDVYMLNFQYVKNGREIVWLSERDGWNHLYLFDGKTGELKNRITEGAFVVRNIVYVDEKKRRILFTASGREPGRDPYLLHLYRVDFDGSDLRLLTPENAEHEIHMSPDGSFFVDNVSRVDQAPKSILKKSGGQTLRVLESANIEKLLATGWKWPEPFCVKARDGKTDIYGVIFRPSNFDPSRKYPVIDATYTGPHTFRTPKSFYRAFRNQDQPIAELGFIVVTVDGFGSAKRSRSFHDFSYKNLGDIGAEDHITAIRQLAGKYPWMDISRVGIYGHSAGGYDAAHALLTHPEFYKVAVASAGNHDHRMAKVWWPELYMGPLGAHYEEQSNLTLAGNLEGKLLLVHGDMDNNVHPSCTMRFVDALIKANKDFDLLILPNSSHGMGNHRYFTRRRWDYFVEHLLGVEPPDGYEIAPFSRE